jgi:glycine dehydrogenase subunit 1
MSYCPHTLDDVQEMLHVIGASNIDALFDEIPVALQSQAKSSQNQVAHTELEATRYFRDCAASGVVGLNFLGAGAYEHYIPAAVWDIASRGEFLTAYTPYQAEASQGTLQLIYEYQSLMVQLMAMDCSNASLYDGASALAEAVLMALRIKSKAPMAVLMPETVNPRYRAAVKTLVNGQDIQLIDVPVCSNLGQMQLDSSWNDLAKKSAALVIPQPNFWGNLEEVDALTRWAHSQGLLVIAVVNPTAMALLKPPGQWGDQGADIVVGEGQPLGVPLSCGGPYFGFMLTKLAFVRQMPGRIIGRTVDLDGKTGFTLTLQAREQHIRRAKATSNICTNQGLAVTAATIYMAIMGANGLLNVAEQAHVQMSQLRAKAKKLPNVKICFEQTPFFHETVFELPISAFDLVDALAKKGIQAGLPVLGFNNRLLVCVTETKTDADLDAWIDAVAGVLAA